VAVGAVLAAACSPDAGPANTGADGRWAAPAGFEADPATVAMCPASDSLEVPEPVEVAAGLEVPWDMAFLPDGRVLVVERAGTIRQIVDGELAETPWATVPVRAVAETGLLGIAVDPEFESTGHVYVVATSVDASIPARLGRLFGRLLGERDVTAWTNRIVRLTDFGGRGVDPTVVVEGLAVGPIHAGGGLRFGPDGRLYVGIGEGGVPGRSADPSSAGGKIHVVDVRAGGEPRVFASGFRNPQSFAFHPGTGDLLVADHGPTGLPVEGFRTSHDELDLVRDGESFGWPTVAGRWRGEGVPGLPPIVEWTPSIAPGGVTVVHDTASAWHGNVLVASLVQGQLVRLSVDRGVPPSDSLSVQCMTNLYVRRFGRLRAVQQGPDGDIWFTTSNRDQRGTPGETDDRLLRFPPPATQAGESR
jgi:glucose/arabinose dehydrogenase